MTEATEHMILVPSMVRLYGKALRRSVLKKVMEPERGGGRQRWLRL